jgi:hypothetical protein
MYAPLQYIGSGCESHVTTCDEEQQNLLVNTSSMYSAASAVLDNDNVTITLSLSIVLVTPPNRIRPSIWASRLHWGLYYGHFASYLGVENPQRRFNHGANLRLVCVAFWGIPKPIRCYFGALGFYWVLSRGHFVQVFKVLETTPN